MRCSSSSTSCWLIAGITGGASCAGTETLTPGALTCTAPFGDTFTFAPGALIATAPPAFVFTDAAGFIGALGAGPPPGTGLAVDGSDADALFIKSSGTLAAGAGAATCCAPNGDPCALDAEGAFTCAPVATGPFFPIDTTDKIIATAATAHTANVCPEFHPPFFATIGACAEAGIPAELAITVGATPVCITVFAIAGVLAAAPAEPSITVRPTAGATTPGVTTVRATPMGTTVAADPGSGTLSGLSSAALNSSTV